MNPDFGFPNPNQLTMSRLWDGPPSLWCAQQNILWSFSKKTTAQRGWQRAKYILKKQRLSEAV
jgi:hypothetical protein